jgi:hypothetical protein
MSLRDEPIQDSVSDGGLSDVLVPFTDRKLGYDDGLSVFVAVFEELK